MERIIVEKSKYISTKDVNLQEGVIIVYYNNNPIGSVVLSGAGIKGVRMSTVFEDNLFDSLEDLIDALFDYEFRYITE